MGLEGLTHNSFLPSIPDQSNDVFHYHIILYIVIPDSKVEIIKQMQSHRVAQEYQKKA